MQKLQSYVNVKLVAWEQLEVHRTNLCPKIKLVHWHRPYESHFSTGHSTTDEIC